MKWLLFILMLFVFFQLNAQNIEFCNSYVYSQQPANDYVNCSVFAQPNGKLFICYYSNQAITELTNTKEKITNYRGYSIFPTLIDKYLWFVDNTLAGPIKRSDTLGKIVTFEINNQDTIVSYLTDKYQKLYLIYTSGKIDKIINNEPRFFMQLPNRNYHATILGDSTLGSFIKIENQLHVYKIVNKKLIFLKNISVRINPALIYFWNDTSMLIHNTKNDTVEIIQNKKSNILFNNLIPHQNQQGLIYQKNSRDYYFYSLHNNKTYSLFTDFDYSHSYFNQTFGQLFSGSTNRPTLHFTYLQKMPNVFHGENSFAIFTLHKGKDNTIWAGSYKGPLAKINGQHIENINRPFTKYLEGGLTLKDKTYFINEGVELGKPKILALNSKKKFEGIVGTENVTGFYLYKSKNNKVYYGTYLNGLWECDADAFYNNQNIQWNKIDTNQTNKLKNVITICEDPFGRIWYGHPYRGIALYNPKKNTNEYLLLKKNEIEFGAISSLCDSVGKIWFGSNEGLYYCNVTKENLRSQNFYKINHPLLNKSKISAMYICQSNLIILANNKVVILDLDLFYRKNEINLKYLTEQESNFSAVTEQNCLLADDSGKIWFATSDMLYKWDFDFWKKIPRPLAQPELSILFNNTSFLFDNIKSFKLSPRNTSFSLEINYNTPDKLIRYHSIAWQYGDDTLSWTEPSTETKFNFTNLRAGNYTLHFKIFELNGKTYYYKYQIQVQHFWFENPWVWLLGIIAGATIAYYIMYIRNKAKLNAQKLLSSEAIAKKEKVELQKKMTEIQVKAIGGHFNPHFLLNILTTAEAQLSDNSPATRLISNLKESIEVLYEHSQHNSVTHPLNSEWIIIQNSIELFKQLHHREIECVKPSKQDFEQFGKLEIPFAILQIHVENALLHGIKNSKMMPHFLKISLQNSETYLYFKIEDNGIGRARSMNLPYKLSHGTAIEKMNEMIEILNKMNSEKITMKFEDNIFKENNVSFGTRVIISIPKNYNYEFEN
ncbi:MAG: hypothetical protein R2831_03710 [Chitinophagaceae bacterium]